MRRHSSCALVPGVQTFALPISSIVTTTWDRRAVLHQSRLAEASSVYDPSLQHAMTTLQSSGLSEPQSLGALAHTLAGQAYLMSALDIFWFAGWLSFAVIGLVWFVRRPHGGAQIGRAHVCTPVTNAHLVCRLLLEKQNRTTTNCSTIIKA